MPQMVIDLYTFPAYVYNFMFDPESFQFYMNSNNFSQVSAVILIYCNTCNSVERVRSVVFNKRFFIIDFYRC